MAGFAAILREVAMEWPLLNTPESMENGVLWLIRAIDDDMHKLEDMGLEEWKLRKQVA